MTWAEYLAWWQDPINLWHTFVCACLYAFGRARGQSLERRNQHVQLMDQLDIVKRLVRQLLNSH